MRGETRGRPRRKLRILKRQASEMEQWRKKRGWSQAEMGFYFGMRQGSYARLELAQVHTRVHWHLFCLLRAAFDVKDPTVREKLREAILESPYEIEGYERFWPKDAPYAKVNRYGRVVTNPLTGEKMRG